MASEVFALTDEQILEIEPEQAVVAQDATDLPGSLTTTPSSSRPESRAVSGSERRDPSSIADEPRASVPPEAPAWLVERMKDPWSGTEAREFWDVAQKAERDAAAYREVFATPEDAKALKELYPGGAAEAKGAADKARQLEDIDSAYFGAAGKSPEELSSARLALAEKLFAQHPTAFREMVAVGARLLESAGKGPANGRKENFATVNENGAALGRQDAASGERSLDSDAQTARVSGRDDHARLAVEYRDMERTANAELEKSVGATIARMMDEALPNLRHASGVARDGQAREGQAPPLQLRLADAVREEVEAGLKSDTQLGEQVAKILSGRRFDEAARRQVVRLIDTRAQQLVPGAVRRVVGTWTQGTLGSARKTERTAPQDERLSSANLARPAPRTNNENTSATKNQKKDTALRATAAGRSVDYQKLSDEQILNL